MLVFTCLWIRYDVRNDKGNKDLTELFLVGRYVDWLALIKQFYHKMIQIVYKGESVDIWLLMNEIQQSVSYVALNWNKLLYNISSSPSHYCNCLHHSPIAYTSTLFEEENGEIIFVFYVTC